MAGLFDRCDCLVLCHHHCPKGPPPKGTTRVNKNGALNPELDSVGFRLKFVLLAVLTPTSSKERIVIVKNEHHGR